MINFKNALFNYLKFLKGSFTYRNDEVVPPHYLRFLLKFTSSHSLSVGNFSRKALDAISLAQRFSIHPADAYILIVVSSPGLSYVAIAHRIEIQQLESANNGILASALTESSPHLRVAFGTKFELFSEKRRF